MTFPGFLHQVNILKFQQISRQKLKHLLQESGNVQNSPWIFVSDFKIKVYIIIFFDNESQSTY